jgi:predicted metalloprotease
MIEQFISRKRRGMMLAALSALTIPGSTLLASGPADDPERLTLTAREIEASNEEAAAAYSALVSMWTSEFRRLGLPFRAPRIVRYRGNTRTSCGVVPASNALYCYNNNTIYFDEVFLAAQAKITGRSLGTDGDMAGVGIIAHEMGHAVAFQLGFRSRSSYENEAVADCLAGAFARYAQHDGSLEDGDTEEAFFAMAAAADPDLEPTGNRRVDARRAARQSRGAHGTREQRQRNFRAGLERGGRACLDELR